MDKKMKKPYESPSTKCTLVEMEAGLCAASSQVRNPNENHGRILEHETNSTFNNDFTGGGWDTDPNNSSTTN